MDVVVGLLVLILAMPLLLLAMLATWFDSAGSPLFHQVRVGRDGQTFRILKLRTMFVDNDESANQSYFEAFVRGAAERQQGIFKLVHDPRITRVGRVLRRYSIDELPQMWNVVKGDMSLVGPRPPLPREVDLYLDDAAQRLRVKPGVTGLWQVSGRNKLSFDEMVAVDVRYWQSWSPHMELSILLRTPRVVLKGEGA